MLFHSLKTTWCSFILLQGIQMGRENAFNMLLLQESRIQFFSLPHYYSAKLGHHYCLYPVWIHKNLNFRKLRCMASWYVMGFLPNNSMLFFVRFQHEYTNEINDRFKSLITDRTLIPILLLVLFCTLSSENKNAINIHGLFHEYTGCS